MIIEIQRFDGAAALQAILRAEEIGFSVGVTKGAQAVVVDKPKKLLIALMDEWLTAIQIAKDAISETPEP